jgi:hypothetical protein
MKRYFSDFRFSIFNFKFSLTFIFSPRAPAKNKKKYRKQKTERQNTLKNKEKIKTGKVKTLNFIFFTQVPTE